MEDRAMSHRKETEAMVAEQPIEDWAQIHWRKLERKVYRLQKRIYQASLRGNDKAVHNLQRLLMKSKAARTLAVRRVTQDNQGKRTAGVDGVKSVKPAQRLALAQQLRHHKRIKPRPTRRVWIPKPGKAEKRPLGIPIRAVHYPSFQAMLGIPCVLLLVDRELRSTVITLLYHTFPSITSASVLPLPFDGLAQRLDDLGRERNPTWPQRGRANALQEPRFAPVGDRGDIHVEQFGSGFSRIAPISPLPSWCGFRALGAPGRDVIGVANPLDFADRQRASHASSLSFLIEEGSNLRIGVRRRPFAHALDHLRAGLAFFPRHFVAWDGKTREGLGLPPNSHIDDVAPLGKRHVLDQPPQQLFPLGKGRRVSVPDGWQVVGKLADLLALRGTEREGSL